MKQALTRQHIMERRDQIIKMLHKEGYTCGDISEILNNLDRSWIWRIVNNKKLQKVR